ncbi:MAG: ABC transporter ATP-binding protein [Thermoplasmata archaeon]|nr:ABC transporter ATP-binding protein [Thermoplasmata archaeon]
MDLIRTDSLTKRYGSIVGLSGLTVTIPTGTIALVGPNGAGKSTFLRLLLGLLEPTQGTAQVLGQEITRQGVALREQVGYMPEHDCLIPAMTGIGFVAYMGRLSGLPKSQAFGRAHDVLQFVGLREERYRKISEYSVGMRQRVKLAQAIVHDPALTLLDEPTAGLDPTGRAEMLALLKVLSDTKDRSLVLSTHLLPDVEGLCDFLVVLNDGRLLAAAPTKEILSGDARELVLRVKGDLARFVLALGHHGVSARPARHEVRIDRPVGGERVLFEAAAEAECQIRYLGPATRSIEELFLQLVPGGTRVAPP